MYMYLNTYVYISKIVKEQIQLVKNIIDHKQPNTYKK